MAEYTLRVRTAEARGRRPRPGRRLLGGLRGRPRPHPVRPRRPAPGQGPPGRLARRALLVPRRDLRLVRRQGERPVDARLQDPARRGARRGEPPQRLGRPDRRRAHGEHAGDQGPRDRHGVDALGEDAPRHAVAPGRRQPARARARRPPREHGRHHADDLVHPVRRLRLGLPLDGGRPRLHRPGRARQGLPLRRRPARRRDGRAPLRPRAGPARHLRLHPLLQLHHRVPQGRRSDEPDHAPPPRRRRGGDRRQEQRPQPRGGVHEDHREEGNARRVAAPPGVARAGPRRQDEAEGRDGPPRVAPHRDPRHQDRQDALALEADPRRPPQAPGRRAGPRREDLRARRGVEVAAQPLHHGHATRTTSTSTNRHRPDERRDSEKQEAHP